MISTLILETFYNLFRSLIFNHKVIILFLCPKKKNHKVIKLPRKD